MKHFMVWVTVFAVGASACRTGSDHSSGADSSAAATAAPTALPRFNPELVDATPMSPQEEEALFVEYYESLTKQVKLDAPKLTAAVRAGELKTRHEARSAVVELVNPGTMRLRPEFFGPRTAASGLTVPLVTSRAGLYAAGHKDIDRREAERMKKALEPEMKALLAAVEEKFPDDGGTEAGAEAGAEGLHDGGARKPPTAARDGGH